MPLPSAAINAHDAFERANAMPRRSQPRLEGAQLSTCDDARERTVLKGHGQADPSPGWKEQSSTPANNFADAVEWAAPKCHAKQTPAKTGRSKAQYLLYAHDPAESL